MKKSLLAILISSAVVLSGCNDKENQEKTTQTEQSAVNLRADLEKTQAELKTTQEALAKAQSEIPVLFVKNIEIFKKSEEFHRSSPAKSDELSFDESSLNIDISAVDTGVQWVNDLIYQKMLADDFSLEDRNKEQEIRAIADPKARLQAYFAYDYDLNRKSTANFETRAYEYSQVMRYIGQRQNIMSFEQNFYVDNGGAHPNGWTNYINIDANKKAIIDLDMAFGNNQAKLKEALWQAYKTYNEMISEGQPVNENEFFVQKADFYPSEDFYFSVGGVNFVYAPYAIGPYMEGEIVLTLPWEVASDLLNPEYIW